jgi:hypothetical protein
MTQPDWLRSTESEGDLMQKNLRNYALIRANLWSFINLDVNKAVWKI